jgi:hypothetical protein
VCGQCRERVGRIAERYTAIAHIFRHSINHGDGIIWLVREHRTEHFVTTQLP